MNYIKNKWNIYTNLIKLGFSLMHKISVVILSFSILFQSFSFDLDDFDMLPTLVDHIKCHLEIGDNFGDFITKHYGSELNNHKNEHKEHDKLPFKHEHLEVHSQLVYTLYPENDLVYFKEALLKKNKFLYKEPSSNLFVTTFFQPPQK